MRQSGVPVHASCDGFLAGFDAADTAGSRRVQSHLIHILHVVMPMLPPPLDDRADDSVGNLERCSGALTGANDGVESEW